MEGGVPEGARWTPVPDAFFSQILPAVADAATLKVALHVLWRVKRRPLGDPPALRFDDLANQRRLPGYALVNLSADWSVAPEWTLRGRLNNLFDAQYALAGGYNTADRNVFVGLEYRPR